VPDTINQEVSETPTQSYLPLLPCDSGGGEDLPFLVASVAEAEEEAANLADEKRAALWALWDAWMLVRVCPSTENLDFLKWYYCEYVRQTNPDSLLSIAFGEYETTITLRLENTSYSTSIPTMQAMRVHYAK
jgi:hypothetical protein